MNISETAFTSKPNGERLEKETRCYDLLNKLGIQYSGLDSGMILEFSDPVLNELLFGNNQNGIHRGLS